MAAEDIVPKEYQRLVSVSFYLVGALGAFILFAANLYVLLAVAGVVPSARFTGQWTQFLLLLSVSVVCGCVVGWAGMILGILKSDERFRTLITRGLIAGLLSAVLSAIVLAMKRLG